MSEQNQATATAAEEVQEAEPGQETTSTEADSTLGDAGKKAIDAMKSERNAARAEARQFKEQLEALQRELANKDKPAEEQALEKARAEARAEAAKQANQRILRAELKALATGKLADPTDAHLYINLDDFTVDDNGDVDSDALTDAISDLISRKPHLAAGKQARFDGAADQGAKGKDAAVQQLTRADLAQMSPEQIAAADAAGQLNSLKGIKP